MNNIKSHCDKSYDPATSVDFIQPSELFSKQDFTSYIETQFSTREKIYDPLRTMLSDYDIEHHLIMGTDYGAKDTNDELSKFEEAKLTVLVRRLSKENRKWRTIIGYTTPSMSSVPGSNAPSSVTHREVKSLISGYVSGLRSGIPAAVNARELFMPSQNNMHCRFELIVNQMCKSVSSFISARQREKVVTSFKLDGNYHPDNSYNYWPVGVSPDFGITEAIEAAKCAFIKILDSTHTDAEKDMARIRLLKDFFLDSESSFWKDICESNMEAESQLPSELGKLDLDVQLHDLREKVALAFDMKTDELPASIIAQAEYLIWFYYLKHSPSMTQKLSDFHQYLLPHYIALAAVIIYDLHIKGRKIDIKIPGETNRKVSVYKTFQRTLEENGVSNKLTFEENIPNLNKAFNALDTKLIVFMTTLFSLATNGDENGYSFLRMDYVEAHGKVRVKRTALLAELPQMLKPYCSETASRLIEEFTGIMQVNTCNPLV